MKNFFCFNCDFIFSLTTAKRNQAKDQITVSRWWGVSPFPRPSVSFLFSPCGLELYLLLQPSVTTALVWYQRSRTLCLPVPLWPSRHSLPRRGMAGCHLLQELTAPLSFATAASPNCFLLRAALVQPWRHPSSSFTWGGQAGSGENICFLLLSFIRSFKLIPLFHFSVLYVPEAFIK